MPTIAFDHLIDPLGGLHLIPFRYRNRAQRVRASCSVTQLVSAELVLQSCLYVFVLIDNFSVVE